MDTGRIALALAGAVLVGLPVLTGCVALAENLRTGETAMQRRLLGGGLAAGLARAFFNCLWTLWLTALLLPFWRLAPARACAGAARRKDATPPVLLVHGLYHNPAAWLVMRQRLAAAGFEDVRCFAYGSFGPEFRDIAAKLGAHVRKTAQEAPGGRVLLMGHSLGGLLIRAAWAGLAAQGGGDLVAGAVTLGAPHRGSTLAGMLGMGRLARSLAPSGAAIGQVRSLPPVPAAGRGLSLHTPTDAMVLPFSGALLEERELALGWREETLPAMSHVGLLYSGEAARRAIKFLQICAGR